MVETIDLAAPKPQSKHEQMPSDVFSHAADVVTDEDIASSADAGYLQVGDTVILERSSGELDGGWAFVGVDAYELAHGIFVKILDDHRAMKSYPFHWDKV